MKATPSQVRVHRILGCLAVLHAMLVAVPLLTGAYDAIWFWWFWVVLATLWFFWPLVLAVHPGRSLLRIVVPLILAYPGYFVWSGGYSNVLVRAFHLEESYLGFDLSPHSMLPYAFAYGVGWADAKKDAKAGRLILESFGFGTFTPGAPNFSDSARQQYGIELNQVAGCVVNERIMGHAKGYNDVMMKEIKRRCGIAVITEAEKEDARWLQSYEDGKEAGRAEALSELEAGRLAIEVSDHPKKGDAEFEQMLLERYQVSLRRVDPHANPKMTNKVFGHKEGYNEVAEAEIIRRFGEDTVASIWKSFYQASGPD